MKIGENIAMLRRKKGVDAGAACRRTSFYTPGDLQLGTGTDRAGRADVARARRLLRRFDGRTAGRLPRVAPAPALRFPSRLAKAPLEVQTTVPAAKALRAVLWAYAGLTAAEILLQLAKSAAAMLLCSLCGIFAAAANLAVFILFSHREATFRPPRRTHCLLRLLDSGREPARWYICLPKALPLWSSASPLCCSRPSYRCFSFSPSNRKTLPRGANILSCSAYTSHSPWRPP